MTNGKETKRSVKAINTLELGTTGKVVTSINF